MNLQVLGFPNLMIKCVAIFELVKLGFKEVKKFHRLRSEVHEMKRRFAEEGFLFQQLPSDNNIFVQEIKFVHY